jgi:hypothetical protein
MLIHERTRNGDEALTLKDFWAPIFRIWRDMESSFLRVKPGTVQLYVGSLDLVMLHPKLLRRKRGKLNLLYTYLKRLGKQGKAFF